MDFSHEIEMSAYEGGEKSKDEHMREMQAKLDAVEKQI